MTGYYETKTTPTGKEMFNLKAANHEIILTSQHYTSKEAMRTGIASVQTNGPEESSFERKTSAKEEAYFVVKAGNGQVIGTSQMYSSEAARDKGIDSVKSNASTDKVVELA